MISGEEVRENVFLSTLDRMGREGDKDRRERLARRACESWGFDLDELWDAYFRRRNWLKNKTV